MTLGEFNRQDDKNQAGSIIEKGILLATRNYKEFRIFLYQIDGFYVEVYFNQRYNLIQGLSAFENANELEPYIKNIPIPELS